MSTSQPPPTNSRFGPYRTALKALSTRTGTPLSSLLVSFGILHELTALVPLVGTFYAARALGVGERVVGAVLAEGESGWVTDKCRNWVEEGDGWAERVGRRYGVFGFEKGSRREEGERVSAIAGDVANAVVGYGVTKALLPLRIGLSLYLSPAFSRVVVEPFRRRLMRPFKRS